MENKDEDVRLWAVMTELSRQLRDAKPQDRSEKARRYTVAITEFEKVMGYFNTFILEDWDNENLRLNQ